MAEPMYRQIADDLRGKIDSGEIPHGAQLPTEIELMDAYSASRNTVRDAIKLLTTRGMVEEDFREMKQLGANVVRIHLQVAKFMDAPDKPNAASLAQLTKLLALAESNNLRLDLTGLACYRRADVPA